jgi:hypothetical protein
MFLVLSILMFILDAVTLLIAAVKGTAWLGRWLGKRYDMVIRNRRGSE